MKDSRRWARRRVSRSSGLAGVAVRSLAFLVLVACCVIAIQAILGKAHSFAARSGMPAVITTFQFSDHLPAYGIQSRNRRVVYPYSVIPGGVRSSTELREIAQHDPVVAGHYSGFDYSRARVIEVDNPRLVYVSYRRAGQIHWTSKQATLLKGELLLTDGHITARTRCGNQVSVLPQANISPQEPTMAELERPDAVASGMEQFFPQTSAALNLDPMVPLARPFGAFPQTGGFMPLPPGPIGTVTCPPNNNKKGANTNKKSKTECKTPPPPAPVPEPGTILLVTSGAFAVYGRYRLRKP
jgi:hypothetical protein